MAELQTARPVEIITPLGDDILLFHRMTATEELGRLFQFELDLLSMNPNIQFEDLLGQNVTIRLDLPNDQTRYFNGFVSRFSQEGSFDDFNAYSVTVHPWLWFLTRTADCRIFQEKKVPEIITEVFRDHGFTDFEELLSGSYRTWEYCVQYRETDFNFVSRLMEQEGIYYFFRHESNKHTLVLSDSVSSHEAYPGYERLPYFPPDEHLRRERDHIYDWNISQEVQPGVYALNDFDFTRPKANLEVKSTIKRDHARASMEIYDYPGEYPDTGYGENYVRARIEELQAEYEEVQGQANARGLAVGSLFELVDYPRTDQNREYLIVSASHEVASDAYSSGSGSEAGEVYSCSFTALPSNQPYRPARTTPKPIVQGPQTAIVVGPSGEEIYTDKYGRVKTQFHWDRYGKYDENSSCWIRVSHPTAGKNWGSVQIPRIGQEVIVEFLEGDPDRPIISGRVYNAIQKPPFGLPGSGMVSGMKSNSTPGGGGYNEISMNDTKGKEGMTIHAQYNQDTTVENDQSVTVVSGNRTVTVQSGTQSETIKGDASVTVQAGSRPVKVTGGDYSATSTDAAANIKGQTSVSITGASAGVTVDGTGGPGVQITGSGSTGVGIKGTGVGVTIDGTANIEAKAAAMVAVKGGTMVNIESPVVQIGNAMITIKGTTILLDGGGGKIMLDGSGVTIMGPKIDSIASGPHTVMGAVVKIN